MKWINEFLYLVSFQVRPSCLSNGLNVVFQSPAITKLEVPVNDIMFFAKRIEELTLFKIICGGINIDHI